jgi:hypothetical protein
MVAAANGRTITTKEASLKTANISIKALTVNGKQVTMGLFRQLKDEDVICLEHLELQGVAWGHVNYFFGDCQPDHLHVVWQKGEELRRSCVYRRQDRMGYWGWRDIGILSRLQDECREYARLYFLAGVAFEGKTLGVTKSSLQVSIETVAGPMYVRVDQDWFDWNGYSRVLSPKQAEKIVEDWSHAHGGTKYGMGAYSMWLDRSAQDLKDAQNKYDALYHTLEQTDQLFIAV